MGGCVEKPSSSGLSVDKVGGAGGISLDKMGGASVNGPGVSAIKVHDSPSSSPRRFVYDLYVDPYENV